MEVEYQRKKEYEQHHMRDDEVRLKLLRLVKFWFVQF